MFIPSDPRLLEALKQQHHFDRWRTRNRMARRLFVRDYFLAGTESPDWTPLRIRRVGLPGFPRQIASVWVPGADAPGASGVRGPHLVQSARQDPAEVLQTDCFECPSLGAAHEFLLRLLGEFQLPGVSLREQGAHGDVYFTAPGESVAVFARANLVILLRSGGRLTSPVTSLAGNLDSQIAAEPAGVPAPAPVRARRSTRSAQAARPAGLKVKVGSAVALSPPGGREERTRAAINSTSPAPKSAVPGFMSPMRKVFSQLGDITAEGDELVYHPDTRGMDDVDIYLVAPTGAVSVERVQYQVE